MNYEETRSIVSEKVKQYLEKNAESCAVPFHVMMNDESKQHIVNIGTSIMLLKWNLGPTPGSFVQAIVENNLYESVNRADSVNREVLPFYVTMLNNLPMPIELSI